MAALQLVEFNLQYNWFGYPSIVSPDPTGCPTKCGLIDEGTWIETVIVSGRRTIYISDIDGRLVVTNIQRLSYPQDMLQTRALTANGIHPLGLRECPMGLGMPFSDLGH